MLMAARKGIFTPVPDPTPAEIAARCLEIQAGWTDKTRERRRVDKQCAVPWTVPEVELYEELREKDFWFLVV